MKSFQSSSDPEKKIVIHVAVQGGGGGHYATYNALRSIIEQQQRPWELIPIPTESIAKRLVEQNKSSLDIYAFFGTNWTEFYDQILKNGWTWLFPLQNKLNKLLLKLNYAAGVSILEQEWRNQQPDLVLSLIPAFNKLIWESIQRAKPDTPVVTILTDFADCPSAGWIEPDTKNYVICGTEKAVEQAQDLGVNQQRIIKTSGLVIHPRFYQPIDSDRRNERQRLGLDPDCVTGLVFFGGSGSKVMLDIAKRLEYFQQKLQLIFLCGHNEEVALVLNEHKSLQKRFVITFTKDIPYYMHLADFFIGKPGNVSISEALVMKLPMIVERNFLTLPQERYAADWIQEQKVGLTIRSFRNIQKAVEQFIEPENFARYRANVAAINNQAVFEIPDILNKILATESLSQAINLKRNTYGNKEQEIETIFGSYT
jgi:1,2-diacylglycerol 3-beta-galactosyltransferase